MKIGLCTSPEKFAKAKEAGFDFVDPFVPCGLSSQNSEEQFQAILDAKAATGMPTLGAAGLFPGDIHLAGPDMDMAKTEAHLRVVFQRALKAGVSILVFGSGNSRRFPVDGDIVLCRKQLIQSAKLIAQLAGEYGVTIALETLNCHETNAITSIATATALVQEVNHPNFKLMFDMFHFAKTDNDLMALALALPHIVHMHISTYANRQFPGVEECDFVPYFHLLKQAGYDGGIAIEACDPPNDEAMAVAVKTIKEQWEKA